LRPAADEAFAEWVVLALAGASIVDPVETIRLLQLTMFGAFVAVAHGRSTLAETGTLLDLAARRLVVETDGSTPAEAGGLPGGGV
jgi:hypothetical protein